MKKISLLLLFSLCGALHPSEVEDSSQTQNKTAISSNEKTEVNEENSAETTIEKKEETKKLRLNVPKYTYIAPIKIKFSSETYIFFTLLLLILKTVV